MASSRSDSNHPFQHSIEVKTRLPNALDYLHLPNIYWDHKTDLGPNGNYRMRHEIRQTSFVQIYDSSSCETDFLENGDEQENQSR